MKNRRIASRAAFFKRARALCGLVIMGLTFGERAAAQPSNYEVLQGLCRSIALQADSILGRSSIQSVVLARRADAETQTPERLLSSSLFEIFTQSSRLVFVLDDTSADQDRVSLALKFKITAWEVNYRKLAKSGWFRKAPVQRAVRVIADFDIYDTQTGRIYFQGPLAESRTDTLKMDINKLESSSLSYTAGVWQSAENRRSWLEPVLLTAATGAIVYAFYSLRSQ